MNRQHRPLIIGFSGKKRVGKDTAADIAVENHNFEKGSFAAPIKTVAREVFLLNDQQLYGDLKEVEDPHWGMSPREIMQKVGTDFARTVYHEDLWIDNFKKRMEKTDKDRIVISDVRFPNEVYAIQALGGLVIRIRRPGVEPYVNSVLRWACQTFPSLSDYLGTKYHQSETALDNFDDFDLTIVNDSGLEDFKFVVNKIIRRFLISQDPDHGQSQPLSNLAAHGLRGVERAGETG